MSNDEFWDRVEDVNAGMLDATDGARLVPMSHYADKANHTLWFITAKGTDAVDAVEAMPKECTYVLSDNGKGVHADLKGTLSLSQDRAKLAELWNPVADSWFPDGQDDPAIRLLSFRINSGEVWVTPTSGLRFMFEVAKAQLTGEQPDMGDHFKI